MIGNPQPCDTLSLEAYAAGLAAYGKRRVVTGREGTFWVGYESIALMRMPVFHTVPPSSDELYRVLWQGRAAMASYLQKPDDLHPATAWLYVCTDNAYHLDTLAPAVRRNVRRGLKALRIEPVASERLLAHGAQAFCDTRQRNGLSDGTAAHFRRRYGTRSLCPGHTFLGAWKGDILAAFLSIVEVDDWVEIESGFSMNDCLSLRPNDALFYVALRHYLSEGARRLVSYGVSSIQADSHAAGLHRFKTKLGFEARPVHRAFVFHPLLRPLVGRVSRRTLRWLQRQCPGHRWLKKAVSVVDLALDGV